jgi:hypothetical protein
MHKKSLKELRLTQEIVRELLDYDPETGALTWRQRDREWFTSNRQWKTWNKRFSVKPAGRLILGYRRVKMLGAVYYAHRLIWLWMTGLLPKDQIDHINRDGTDNCWSNLREATYKDNRRNLSLHKTNTTGRVGVYPTKCGTYQATISSRPSFRINLGCFPTFEQACAARKEAERQHGYSEGHGSPRKQGGHTDVAA